MISGLFKGTVLPLLYIGVAAFIGCAPCSTCSRSASSSRASRWRRTPGGRSGSCPASPRSRWTARDGTRLHGWFRLSGENAGEPSPRGLVIYFGATQREVSGQMFDAEQLAPWSVAAVNYRGYGLSEGDPARRCSPPTPLPSTTSSRRARTSDTGSYRHLRTQPRQRSRGAACRAPAGARGHAHLPLRQPAKHRQEAISDRSVSLLLKHPFDLAGAGAEDRIAPAGARGKPGYADSPGFVAAPARCPGPARSDGNSFRGRITTTSTPNPATGLRCANSSPLSRPGHRESDSSLPRTGKGAARRFREPIHAPSAGIRGRGGTPRRRRTPRWRAPAASILSNRRARVTGSTDGRGGSCGSRWPDPPPALGGCEAARLRQSLSVVRLKNRMRCPRSGAPARDGPPSTAPAKHNQQGRQRGGGRTRTRIRR